MKREIELKLELAPEAADLFEHCKLWPEQPNILAQRAIYFDTPDFALSNAGLSLRIRQSGKALIQTVKANGGSAAGLFARAEWEFPVDSHTPVVNAATPVAATIGDKVDVLAPIFEVRIERHRWMVDQDGAAIELVLDRGEAVACERITRICEIELELKHGDPAALFALARRIDAVVPVRLQVLSKSERGYRLLTQAVPMVKAGPVALSASATAAEAFRQIVQSCIRQFRLNEALLQPRRNAAALHQTRVALRRLRSAFSTFRTIIGGNHQAILRGELRWLASELGDARNLDVLLERAPSGKLHDQIAVACEAAYQRVGEVLGSARVRALMLDLAAWTSGGDWTSAPELAGKRDEAAHKLASKVLDRFYRKVMKGGRDLELISDEARHQLRKDAKRLRYASDFFVSMFATKRQQRHHRKFVAALGRLQDQLGALNDLATVPQLLATLGITRDVDVAVLSDDCNRRKLLKHAAHAHKELSDMTRYWR